MSGDKDRILMRLKDTVLLLIGIGGLLAGLGKLFVLASAIEAHAGRLEKIEPLVATHETRMAVADERWGVIQKQVETINRKLDHITR